MEEYKDKTYNGTGSNWINARAHSPWTSEGGDYLSAPFYEQTFELGTEDLEINISGLVEDWITGSVGGKFEDYGVGVRLIPNQENGNRSYYTKHFSARGSEYFFKSPITISSRKPSCIFTNGYITICSWVFFLINIFIESRSR